MLNTITRQIQNYKIKKIRISTRQKININPIAKLKIKSIKKLASNMINKQINARTRIKKFIVDM